MTDSMQQPTPFEVNIIGGGFSGLMAAYHIVTQKRARPVLIRILEKEPELGGIAYGKADEEHQTNVDGEFMSAVPGKKDDFIQWLRSVERDERWGIYRERYFSKLEEIPRMIYRIYLEDKLKVAVQQAKDKQAAIEIVHGEVVDWERDKEARKDRVTLSDGRMYESDVTVLAVGQGQAQDVPYDIADVKDDLGHIATYAGLPRAAEDPDFVPCYLDYMWAPGAQQYVNRLPRDKTVFVIGTALSAMDVLRSLNQNDHEGRVIFCSRKGLLHNVYPHSDRKLVFSKDEIDALPNNLAQLEVFVRGTIKYYMEHEGYSLQDILVAFDPHINRVLHNLPPDDRELAIKRWKGAYEVARVGMPASMGAMVDQYERVGQMEITSGQIEKVSRGEDGRLRVHVRKRSGELEEVPADCVISARGPDVASKSPLLNLLREKDELASPARILTNRQRRIITCDGTPSESVFAVTASVVTDLDFPGHGLPQSVRRLAPMALEAARSICNSCHGVVGISQERFEAAQRAMFDEWAERIGGVTETEMKAYNRLARQGNQDAADRLKTRSGASEAAASR